MIELLMLGASAVGFIVLMYLEMANDSAGRLPLANVGAKTVGNATASLILYEATSLLATIALTMTLLRDYPMGGFVMIIAVASLAAAVTVFVLNRMRFGKIVIDPDVHSIAYFDSIKDDDPYEGVDYIISYIRDPRWGCPQTDIDKFLLYLVKRDDEFGQAAREKLNERGD